MAVVADNEQAAASDNARPPAAEPTVDPQMLMAARRGDSKLFKELLRPKKVDEVKEEEGVVDVALGSEVVVVDVLPRRPPAAAAAKSAASPPPPLAPLDGVTIDGDSLLHVVAACGDGEEFHNCARLIYCKAMRLLVARNDKDETPLHCAAGAGNAGMISCLIALATGEGETSAKAFLRAQNKGGETALHLAIRAAAVGNSNKKNKLSCVEQLMDADPELAAIPRDEEGSRTSSDASPLYLAISLGEMDIAEHLFDTSGGKLSYSGPDGRNVLHAAVYCVQVVPMVLEWLMNKLKTADMRHEEGVQGDGPHAMKSCSAAADDDLLSRLTSQRDNENRSTPLHLAASMHGIPILWCYPHHRELPGPLEARLLLDANVSTAYLPDNQGLYPIHVAASAGSPETVKALLERCPDCATLRDVKGRTFFHAAVEKMMYNVVNYDCGEPECLYILNMQDNNGDTALHRAVHTENIRVVGRLIRCQQVRLDVPNKEGMRPVDVAWSKMPLRAYYAWNPRIHIRTSLLIMGAPYGKSRGDLFYEKQKTMITHEFEGGEQKISKNVTAAAQILAIFSVLITTVTFATAFTLPGGYRSAGDGGVGAAGTPVLAGRGSYAFDAFILSDALAFACSFVATSILLYAGVPAYSLESRFRSINCAYGLMMNFGRCLLAAFALGLYLVLLPPAGRTIAIAIAVGMIILVLWFTKDSEGSVTSLMLVCRITRSQKLSRWDVAGCIAFVLQHYWSFVLIFGLPAIRKWARAK